MNGVEPNDFRSTATDPPVMAPLPPLNGAFRAFPAYAMIAGLNLTALLMTIRRLSGHPFSGLSAERIGIAAAGAAGMALLAREIIHRMNGGRDSVAWRLCLAFFSSSPLLALAFAVASWRFAFASGAALLTGIVVGSAVFSWPALRSFGSKHTTNCSLNVEADDQEAHDVNLLHSTPRPEVAPGHNRQVSKPDWSLEKPAHNEFEATTAKLRLTRFVTPEGADRLEGTILAEFLPNQKLVTIHIAFCPPFDRPPAFECAAESSGIRIGVTAVYSYGARLELKRHEGIGEPARVPVVFEASFPSTESAAA